MRTRAHRPQLPALLGFIAHTGFPAERVTSFTADWDDAPTGYAAKPPRSFSGVIP
jgi:hypothetical protein